MIELLERNFLQDEILTALAFFISCVTITLPPRRQATATRSATRAQAEDLLKIMANLNKKNRLPRITIHCEDLGRVSSLLSSSVNIRDEKSVCARLESLETGLKKVQEPILQSRSLSSNVTLTPPAVTVTPVVSPAPEPQAALPQAVSYAKTMAVPLVPQQQRRGSFNFHGQHIRDRSPSQKIERDENTWQTQGRRRARKAGLGTSKVDLGEVKLAGQAGPVEYYIGNTTNKADNETIKRFWRNVLLTWLIPPTLRYLRLSF